jgi:hypothetical protein
VTDATPQHADLGDRAVSAVTLSFLASMEPGTEHWDLRPAGHQRLTEAVADQSAVADAGVQASRGLTLTWTEAPVGDALLTVSAERHEVLAPERPGAGVSRVGLVRRRPGLSHADFVEHYLTRHVPLVMATRPLFEGYWVHVALDESCGWDAVVWQQFADLEVWAEHDRQVVESKPEVRADLGRFVGALVSFEARLVRHQLG